MKKVHFSIDDVCASFSYIQKNHPQSIFDMRLYGQLLDWHIKYGLIVSLYCIYNDNDFNLSMVPDKYKSEFYDSRDWLKFGFHSLDDKPFKEDKDYVNSFNKMLEFTSKMKMGTTSVLRLHSWEVTDEQELFLKSRGVDTLLLSKDGNYDDEGKYYNNGIIHRRTDCWMEKMCNINCKELGIGRDYIVLFTHEWSFDQQKKRIDRAFEILQNNEYVFI